MIKIIKYDGDISQILTEQSGNTAEIEKTVNGILADVRNRGDEALYEYSRKFDKADLKDFRVTENEIAEAYDSADKTYIEMLTRARKNIEKFHRKQIRRSFEYSPKNGIVLKQKIRPVGVAAVYVPGGTAGYPSTVLMSVIPAKEAGVKRIVIVTPPSVNGVIRKEVLIAAKVCGVNEIYKIGGAQAIAALAYGTDTIPKADVIAGPGNIYVATAKKAVFGAVGVDMVAGPSEILIIADGSAKAEIIAADLLSQAEHDKLASAILITPDAILAEKVSFEIEKQLKLLPREKIARASIENRGKIVLCKDLTEAVNIANAVAPEHLELAFDGAEKYEAKIENAGSVFVGQNSPEPLGDYYAGCNHTLPTNGTARFASPLSVDDFLKKTQFISYSRERLAEAADDIIAFAESEGLHAHANAVKIRMKK